MTLEKKLKIAIMSKQEEKIYDVFNEIYQEYGKLIYFTILQYINNSMDVEELTQDVFISFYNRISLTSIDNIKYYLIVIAKNKALDFLKQKKCNVLYNNDIVLNEIDKNKEYQDIIDILKKDLNELEIKIILDHIIYDYTFKELSKKYNKPLNTITSIYYRAVNKIKKGE